MGQFWKAEAGHFSQALKGILGCVLFMVIERFRNGNPKPIGERFQRNGRMLPEGLIYRASWVDSTSARCFQVMETHRPELLKEWVSRWDDLIDFEIVPVLVSADFWAQTERDSN